ncbi:glucose-1-phosphate adenylyltransferase [candidate division WOR-3 bacterium]|nr:glucose-1-phosphate adenylyltransferase [candidate division WOR-3 bacterium]
MYSFAKSVMVFILAGGKGTRLYPLTKFRVKPAVPFLGVYRIIDFVLSNAVNSGLRKIVLLTQYLSLSLDRHIRIAWDLFKYDVDGYIYSLPAQHRYGEKWYEGTADAVYQNIYTLQLERPEYLLILSGDHIYKMDYKDLFEFHKKSKSDFTLVALLYPARMSSRFGVLKVNKRGRVLSFHEKPGKPPEFPGKPGYSLVNAGIYLAKTEVIVQALIEDHRNAYSSHDFGKDVIPMLISHGKKVCAYVFDGYWRDIGTLDSYYQTNMDFLSSNPPIDLYDGEFPIRTYHPSLPPAYISRNSMVENSFISNGCRIEGAKVKNSIISPGVIVKKGAIIEDSIVFNDVLIGDSVYIKGCIIDKNNRIEDKNFMENFKRYGVEITQEGVIVMPKEWRRDA